VSRACGTITLMAEPQKEIQETAIPVLPPAAVVMPESMPAPPSVDSPAALIPQSTTVASVAPPVPPSPQTVAATPPAPELMAPGPASGSLPPIAEDSPATETDTQAITWNASEFHGHEKSISWYIILAIVTIGVAAILYLLTKSVLAPVVVIICGVILGIYAAHTPAEISYAMNLQGIRIGTKQYLYNDFQLFTITPDASIPEITLIPVKRFMPSLTLRYTPDSADKVLNMLSAHLPYEERNLDIIDSLMHRIHF
jgi:hypothetical protein